MSEPILDIRVIHTLDLPELAPYRTLRRPWEHQKQGIFVAEGEKVVRRLLDSKLEIVSILSTPRWYEKLQIRRAGSLVVYLADKKLLEGIVGYPLHQGVMALGKIPPEAALEAALAGFPKPRFLVAIDGIVSAENVGIIVRNCAAFGVDGILVGKTSSSPYLRRAVRNSMGAIFRMPVFSIPHLSFTLRWLHERHGLAIVAARPEAVPSIHEADLHGDICIIFGNEGSGISRDVLEVCTLQVGIPMLNQTDSLNVANAGAVFLYEARRQRSFHEGG